MKNTILTILICFSFTCLCNAENSKTVEVTNEKEESTKPCTVYVTITNPDGSTSQEVGKGGSKTWKDCGEYKKEFIGKLEEKLLKFDSEKDVTVIWG